jgi:hypothetical protein
MSDISNDDAGVERIVEKVRKLLNLAAKNPNEAEAASAAAKAQELLAAYNLDMATIGQGGESGAREEAKLRGGMYIYERELWSSIAELNFCKYFTTRSRMKNKAGKLQYSFQHRVIGRVVNTTSSKVMAEYLQGAIERICRERFPQNNQFFLREAVAFREGMSDNIGERLRQRRREVLAEQAAKKREEAERTKGAGTAFALTLLDVHQSEEIANYDFMHGEGAWARMQERCEAWDKRHAERRAAEAAAEAEADAAYARWAEANPEEAAKEAAKEAARQKREQEKANRRSWRSRAPTARERRQNSDYYDAGYEKGSEVSLDLQVGDRSNQRRIGR